MTEIITYRLTATGVWGYEFYDSDRNQIGFVRNAFARSEPVRAESAGISWYSRFGMDNTIVPGTGRQVKDSGTGSEVFRVIYWRPGLYQVRTVAGDSVQVEIRDGQYLFGLPERPVTALTVRTDEADWLPPYAMDVRPWFRTTVYEEVNEAYLMMVLSFPALRFY